MSRRNKRNRQLRIAAREKHYEAWLADHYAPLAEEIENFLANEAHEQSCRPYRATVMLAFVEGGSWVRVTRVVQAQDPKAAMTEMVEDLETFEGYPRSQIRPILAYPTSTTKVA